MSHSEAIARYLHKHCEAGTQTLAETLLTSRFRNVLVVPCFAEPTDFLRQLGAPVDEGVLTIVVVNAPDNASSRQHSQTLELLRVLQAAAQPNQLIVDRVTEPLPFRQGVGLARKTGADLALQLIAHKVIESPWIYFTDADAELPADYFQHRRESAGTLLFEFRHQAASAELQRRINLYEMHLRYYAQGLQLAHSGYAFISLGSIIAVHARAYAEVRGVPKRNAAEDFYLLNKLAKVAPVSQLKTPVITLAGRVSDRVPFGTGPALANMPAASADYLSFAPASFQSLAALLQALDEFASGASWQPPPHAPSLLESLGWQRFLRSFEKLSAIEQRRHQLHEWFDGFRTMRYLRLTSALYPQQGLLATLRRGFADESTSEEELLDLLRHNRNRLTLW